MVVGSNLVVVGDEFSRLIVEFAITHNTIAFCDVLRRARSNNIHPMILKVLHALRDAPVQMAACRSLLTVAVARTHGNLQYAGSALGKHTLHLLVDGFDVLEVEEEAESERDKANSHNCDRELELVCLVFFITPLSEKATNDVAFENLEE